MNSFKVALFNFFNSIIPKRKNIVIFHSSFGYEDSARAVYEKLKNDTFFKIYWLIENNDFPNEELKHCKAIKYKSLKSIFIYFFAKVIISTHVVFDNNHSKKQINILLWHGMPLKNVSKFDKSRTNNYFDLVTVTSDFFTEPLSKLVGCSKESCFPVGLPRNDFLFKKISKNSLGIDKYKKIIIWAPTFRKTANVCEGKPLECGLPILKKSDFVFLNSFLKEHNYLLILKPHPWSADSVPSLDDFSNICLYNNVIKINSFAFYEFLGICDLLITDYSSIYIDFLLTNKPICFAYDDIETYSKDRSFSFENVLDFMPGKHVHNFEELINFLSEIDYKDNYENERNKIKNVFFKYCDQSCSEKIVDYIKDKVR